MSCNRCHIIITALNRTTGGGISQFAAVDFVICVVSQFALRLSGDHIRKEVQELLGQVLVNPSGSCCSAPLTGQDAATVLILMSAILLFSRWCWTSLFVDRPLSLSRDRFFFFLKEILFFLLLLLLLRACYNVAHLQARLAWNEIPSKELKTINSACG